MSRYRHITVLKLYLGIAAIAGAGVFFGAGSLVALEEAKVFRQALFSSELVLRDVKTKDDAAWESGGIESWRPDPLVDCPPPFSCEIRILKTRPSVSFSVRFAEAASGGYIFSFSDTDPDANGIRFESGNGTSTSLFDYEELFHRYGNQPVLELSFEFTEGNLRSDVNGIVLNCGVEIPPERCILEAEGDGFFVSGFTASRTGENGKISRMVDFHAGEPLPVIDLPALAGMDRGSAAALFSGFAVSVAAAALAALLIAAVAGLNPVHRLLFGISLRELLFITMPLQVLAAFASRALLNLPVVPCLVAIPVVLAVNTILIASGKAAGATAGGRGGNLLLGSGKQSSFRSSLIAPVGMIAYLSVVFPQVNRLTEALHIDPAAAAILFALPLIPGLAASLVFRSPMLLFSLVFPAIQALSLKAVVYPGLFPPEPVLILWVVFPWLIWLAAITAVNLKPAALKALLPLLLIFPVLPWLMELTVRANPKLENELDFRFALQGYLWNVTDHTNLFGSFPGSGFLDLRDRAWQVEKPPGVFRIVCAGSSSTWGMGASGGDHAYPAALEEILNHRAGSGPMIEVLNGGVIGAPFYMIRTFLDEILLETSPDVVILYFGLNGDSEGMIEEYDYYRELVAEHPFIDTKEELWCARHLKIVNRFSVRMMRIAVRSRIVTGAIIFLDDAARRKVEDLRRLGNIDFPLKKTPDMIVGDCARRGIPLILVPELARTALFSGVEQHSYGEIFKALAAVGPARLIDIESAVAGRMGEITLNSLSRWFIDEVHMTDEGYRLLADCLADALIREGLVPVAHSDSIK